MTNEEIKKDREVISLLMKELKEAPPPGVVTMDAHEYIRVLSRWYLASNPRWPAALDEIERLRSRSIVLFQSVSDQDVYTTLLFADKPIDMDQLDKDYEEWKKSNSWIPFLDWILAHTDLRKDESQFHEYWE